MQTKPSIRHQATPNQITPNQITPNQAASSVPADQTPYELQSIIDVTKQKLPPALLPMLDDLLTAINCRHQTMRDLHVKHIVVMRIFQNIDKFIQMATDLNQSNPDSNKFLDREALEKILTDNQQQIMQRLKNQNLIDDLSPSPNQHAEPHAESHAEPHAESHAKPHAGQAK